MKHIYFDTPGCTYNHVLSKKGISTCNGYYFFIDILNKTFFIPMSVSYITEEEWDHNTNYLSNIYIDAVKELDGEETGVLKKSKK